MKVKTHDAGIGFENEFRERCILERKACDTSRALLNEFIRAIADGKEIFAVRIPAKGRHMLAAVLVILEFPQGQKHALKSDANVEQRGHLFRLHETRRQHRPST